MSAPQRLSRRRFLSICAAIAAAAPFPATARTSARRHVEQGTLLGADAEIQLYHVDADAARSAMAECFAEVRRLESIFSLQQPDSALSRLNRDARLSRPPPELVTLLHAATAFSMATSGAFDVSVQPLWNLFAGHFSDHGVAAEPPPAVQIESARAKVDYRRLEVGTEQIVLRGQGMAVTLNGVAQGFITDRVTQMLVARGFDRVLVDMGEMRALGTHADGKDWRVGIADPERPWRSLLTLRLRNRAIATSGGYGTPFDASGRWHHLFDPRTGRSAQHYRSVTVVAPDAISADALSTGLSAVAPDDLAAVLGAYPRVGAIIVGRDGRVSRLGDVPAA
jgi:FAD:protein FMN transferase